MTDHGALTVRDWASYYLARWRAWRGSASSGGAAVTDVCECFLPTKLPDGVDWWYPVVDAEPRPVCAVVRYGEEPRMRRAVRVPGGWAEYGALVDYYHAITPPMPWERVGHCWAGTPHPVVAVQQEPGGAWVPLTQMR